MTKAKNRNYRRFYNYDSWAVVSFIGNFRNAKINDRTDSTLRTVFVRQVIVAKLEHEKGNERVKFGYRRAGQWLQIHQSLAFEFRVKY